MDLNRASIIGNVVRDPEIRTTPSGQTVASFSIATNFIWKDQSGVRQQKAEFHNIVAWRRLAEIVGQYVKKGGKVYIEGRIQTRSWDDQNAIKRYRTEIVAENMILLDRAGSSAAAGNDSQARETTQTTEPNPEPPHSQSEEEISIEDIPF